MRKRTSCRLHAVLAATFLSVACSDPNAPDEFSVRPVRRSPIPAQSGPLDVAAAQLVSDAVAGVRRRGAQDEMLQIESRFPGFGGFYIDSTYGVVALMKPGGADIKALRGLLSSWYATDRNPRVREIMAAASSSRLQPAEYSLSELIASDHRVRSVSSPIPGLRGWGVSINKNRLVVGLGDVTDFEPAIASLVSAGIPRGAILPEVWGEIQLSTVTWLSSPRPAGAGMYAGIPLPGDSTGYAGASTGFSVRASNGNTYFLIAGHQPNEARAVNGATGDSIFQPYRISNLYGRVALNPAWETNPTICKTDQRPKTFGKPVPYCTDADVALATYASGSGGAMFKVGTSNQEGKNGASGSFDLNNWYPIQGTLAPEYFPLNRNVVHKSGAKTGTTTGEIALPYTSYYSDVPWPIVAPPRVPTTFVTVWFTGAVRVIHAGWGTGDSGGPVFARDASLTPYFAVGIQNGGEGTLDPNTGKCSSGTACAFYFSPWQSIQDHFMLTFDPRTTP